jgi:cytochrome d ubiquinol oxidase subunit II
MFSGLYSALMLILFALIMRGIAMEYRGQVNDPRWRSVWDLFVFLGSFLPALLLGVAFANIFRGIPIDEAGIYQGTLFTLLNPYGILGGLFFVVMFLVHGALWLTVKSEGDLRERATVLVWKLWMALAVLAVVFPVATWFATRLYDNYLNNPLLYVVPIILIPVIVVSALVMVGFFIGRAQYWKAWFSSSALIVGSTLFGVAGLYPNLLPSSLNPAFSLTIYNSASSQLTLKIMLGVALTFIPVVIAYQIWAYHVFKDRLEEDELAYEESY